jgi:hypothetical protein
MKARVQRWRRFVIGDFKATPFGRARDRYIGALLQDGF